MAHDPYNDETLVPAATFELRHGGAKAALTLLEGAVRRLPEPSAAGPAARPGLASVYATLGDARAVLSDASGAKQAYDQALQLDPT